MGELKSVNQRKYEAISLADWINSAHPDEDDLRAVFVNMDKALKYIHTHGYCIEVFYPTEIMILGNSINHIQFNKLLELSKNPQIKNKMIQEDIFNSSLVQIGIYSKSLNYLKPDFLKEDFDSFTQFVPEKDVAYYRGVIQRDASVYFSDYVARKREKDIEELDRQSGGDGLGSQTGGEGKGKRLVKSNGNFFADSNGNDKVNDIIYSQINGLKDSAFVSYLVLPTVLLITLVIIGIFAWVFSLV